MELIDAHCHLEAKAFDGRREAILADARNAGIVALITAATRVSEWEASQALSERFPEVSFTLGVHPWFVRPADLAAVEALADARERGAVAIGEIGLDAKIESPSMAKQLPVFEAQLRIARNINLPVVIHCRGAFNELLQVLREHGAPETGGIIHAFSGSVEVAEALIAHGLSFSLGGSLSYRNSKKRERVLKRIFPDHMLIETDSPDMPPVQVRGTGEPNVPANIRYNLAGAAETLGVPEETVASVTTANARRVFGLE